MKDGRTHLAHKAEHAVHLDTDAIVAVTLQAADQGDTTTLDEMLCEAGEQVAEQMRREAELRPQDKPKVHLQGIEELVTDKGYHSGAVVQRMKSYEVRTYIPEKKQKGRREWQGRRAEQQAVYQNRRRVRGEYGKSLLRRRGELIERSFAHCYETGGMRRRHLRGRQNILKRQLIHVGAFNLSLILRKLLGAGTPRELKNRAGQAVSRLLRFVLCLMTPPFTGPSTYCRCWSAPRIIFPLPHASSQITKHEQFRHGLLAVMRRRTRRPRMACSIRPLRLRPEEASAVAGVVLIRGTSPGGAL
jgi:transposase